MCFTDNLIRQQGGEARCPDCDSVVVDHRICSYCIAKTRSVKPKTRKIVDHTPTPPDKMWLFRD